LRTAGHHGLLWRFHQELLRLRRNVPALVRLDKDALEATALEEKKVIVLRRWNESSHILALLNFDDEPIQSRFPVPAGYWKRKLDSADPRWGGGGSQTPDVLVPHGVVEMILSPWSAILYEETMNGAK
jgi:maltooligosyltrehalose trehalohydrolase